MTMTNGTDWQKDMGRCVLNSMGECLANIPVACICHQMLHRVFQQAWDRLMPPVVDGETGNKVDG